MRALAAAASVLGVAILAAACSPSTTPEVTPGVDECTYCHMVIDQENQAAGYVRDRGFVPFDSPACLLARFEELRKAGEPMPRAIYFADFGTGEFLLADTVTFLLTTHHPTVMGGEVLAFRSHDAAEGVREHEDEVLTDWVGFRTERGEPDRRVSLSLGPEGLSPESMEVQKDELVELTVTADETVDPTAISIKGYPELEAVNVAPGAPVSFRLLASRPGDGFPVVEDETGEVLGVLAVRGAHTADEEAEGM